MPLALSTISLRRPFWQALAGAGVLMVLALSAMALSLALSLGGAGRLLDRLSRSQNQLAMVTRIEADVSRLRTDVATGATGQPQAASEIVRQLADYRQSIVAEAAATGQGVGKGQTEELANAERLARLFEALRGDMLAADANEDGGKARVRAAQGRFDDLAGQIIARERLETANAIDAMRQLRGTMTVLGVAIPLLVAVFCAAGAGVMLASMLRPLRVLEDAARRAGQGERISPLQVDGFAEFQELALAFNRMDDQIRAQRRALSDVNRGLEAEVAERTRDIEAGRRKLAEIDRTRRLFYSQIGHELRTPVTVIRGEAEIALRDGTASPEMLREALEHVVANGGFLQRRLEDMLALARSEDGKLVLSTERFDLQDLLRETTRLAEPYLRSSGAKLVSSLSSGGGPIIVGDASWMKQGLLALVDNAAKFSGQAGEVRLSFRVGETTASIAVSDSGPGVDEADLPFLFESYYQTSVGRARGGSGLGLAVARWVAEQHGGVISAESNSGEGLTVRIELPVAT
ncbi:MAG: HAMP domain-containing protein [Alphaproteobacteria bacterium]|nr:HAMP domain-containing protein [Alphaproteobacteria bacterium]